MWFYVKIKRKIKKENLPGFLLQRFIIILLSFRYVMTHLLLPTHDTALAYISVCV